MSCGAAAASPLTVLLVALLVHEDVGLHVPDELVGEQLRLLGRPQDVLPHVAHLSQRGRGQSSETSVALSSRGFVFTRGVSRI